MSLRLQRHAELSANQIADLDGALAAFCKNPPASYYQQADEASRHYNATEQPFHWDLLSRVSTGMTVLEVGCGTAHLCSQVEARGGIYTGLDYSEDLLQNNRRRFPNARFRSLTDPPNESYDLVTSLYTLEHIVNPSAYLESLWRYCRPDGLIAVICPEFVEGAGLAPSVFYGHTPRRFRQKLQAFDLLDACAHIADLKIRAPVRKRRLESSPPGAVWSRLADLVWFFWQRGAEILQTSAKIPDVQPDIRRYSCYLLMRKPKSCCSGKQSRFHQSVLEQFFHQPLTTHAFWTNSE